MKHLKAKSAAEDVLSSLPTISTAMKAVVHPSLEDVRRTLHENAHKKTLPPRIKNRLQKSFGFGLKLSVDNWTKMLKVVAGHTPCFAPKWVVSGHNGQELFTEPAMISFYIGVASVGDTSRVTKVSHTVHSSVCEHALIRMLQRECCDVSELRQTATNALHQVADFADFAEAHSGLNSTTYWKKTHEVAVPFRGGALMLTSHFLDEAMAGFSSRNYAVRTWYSDDMIKPDMRKRMNGWAELQNADWTKEAPEFLDDLFEPKIFDYKKLVSRSQ